MNDAQLADLLTTAEEAARAAGDLLDDRWDAERTRHSKGVRDWVTDDDFEAQAVITNLIRARYPEHGFLTEEEDSSLPDQGRVCWIIDPIDGTSNYSRHVPLVCVSLAAVGDGRLLAAAIYDPARRELFSAAAGQGAARNGGRMSVSALHEPEEALVAFDWSHAETLRAGLLPQLERIAPRVHTLRAVGTAALALAWVAAGRLDVYFNAALKPWDVAAGALLLQEAGGKMTDWQNLTWDPRAHRDACLASNGHLHDLLLSLL
jgi:myo-inositol-1(or 4)-monophosphatase